MRQNNQANNGGGIGFFGALTLLFIALKLMGYITWSWWWVLSPLWGFAAFVIVVIVFIALFSGKKRF